MSTPKFGRLRTGPKKSFAATLRENNLWDRHLAANAGVEPQAQSVVSEYKPRADKPKDDGELSELQEQIRVIKWFDANCHLYKLPPVALFAIPNGGSRGMIEAANLKRSGVRAGVEDLFLAVPNRTYHGLFLEMKAGKGTVEMEQSAMHFFHRRSGYCVQVAWENETAIRYIEQYLIEGN